MILRLSACTLSIGAFLFFLYGEAPSANAADESIEAGSGRFLHIDRASDDKRDITVHYHRPEGYKPNSPILFVMHGNSRAAVRYWRQWEDQAKKYNALILVPEFDTFDFPGSASYHSGGIYDVVSGDKKPKHQWTFSIIERIFDQARRLTGSTQNTFHLYGHSAGGQFVHRYLTFTGGPKVKRAVAANPGWYTMPRTDIEYPYGLKDSPATNDNLKTLFASNLTILLGEDDTKQTRSLRQTAEAMDQGGHRLARGKKYYETGKTTAAELNLPFRWRIQIVPDVGHSNGEMAPAAASILFGH
jgi:pimeloyl-ACP methyl ester carboxylesterase